jgi:hypothetical protein
MDNNSTRIDDRNPLDNAGDAGGVDRGGIAEWGEGVGRIHLAFPSA